MKANEAPENIYIPQKIYLPYKDGKVIGLVKEIGEPYKSGVDGNIEYVRTDALVDKACEYLMKYEFNDSPTIADRRKRVENFKKYMEEE